MVSPTVNPAEIQARDRLIDLIKTEVSQSNGYYFNAGDVNVWDAALAENFPRYMIKLGNEETPYGDASGDYESTLKIEITVEWKNTNPDNKPDSDLMASKLTHDIKKLLGNYYKLGSEGVFEVHYKGRRKYYKQDIDLPVGVVFDVDLIYYENRITPTLSVGG